MSFYRLHVGSRFVLATSVWRLEIQVAISRCRILCDFYKIRWPLHSHVFASDRVFEVQSFPLQSDEDFALLQALARTRGRRLQLFTGYR